MPARPISPVRLGETVRELRLERGLTQEQLADAAQIHVTYLSGIETGKKNPTIGLLNAVAGALDVGTIELFRAADLRACSGTVL